MKNDSARMSTFDATPELSAGTVAELRRLGRNVNGYAGETINLRSVLADCTECGRSSGWAIGEIVAGDGQKLLTLHRQARTGGGSTKRVYISAGIHGDEPAGPLAVRELLQEDAFPENVELWVCPCLNPTGFERNRRENSAGTDLNRQYLQPQAKEIIAHIAWLQEQPTFDLCLCLHEDWEANGFYIYELNPDRVESLANAIMTRVSKVCPIEHADVVEGRPAKAGVIVATLNDLKRVDWPEAIFLIMHKTRLSYTFESPSDFPLLPRVNALVAATTAALEAVAGKLESGAGCPGGSSVCT